MYNERAEGGNPVLSSLTFHIHLIYKACRTFPIMVFAGDQKGSDFDCFGFLD